jgi:IstB-like ATP binding protein
MSNFTYERLHDNLQYLKLDTIEAILDNYLELAAKDGKATMDVLDHLFEQERKHRDAAAIDRRMKYASFPVIKTLEEFNFDFQPSIDRSVIEDLATLRFIHNTENLVLLGPPGVGKVRRESYTVDCGTTRHSIHSECPYSDVHLWQQICAKLRGQRGVRLNLTVPNR